MKSRYSLIGCACLILLVIPACNKILGASVAGHYSIRGYLMDSCGGTPLANHTLVVLLTDHAIKNKHSSTNIASGQTDANGKFQIKCPNYGAGEIRIVDSATGFRYMDKYPIALYSDSVQDFGIMYLKPRVSATVYVNITGSYDPDDTLFIGNSAGAVYKYYYPASGIADTVFFTGLISGYDFAPYKYFQGSLYWGVGIEDFKTNMRREYFDYRVCDLADTPTVITLKYP